ncbi:MAG TPA: HTTM domain-containing protein, partial [Candidatus Nanoarchaeia archaeon]|nr:HTTM domain-containing protein [Candidatus Nanoarchaeia archaeon]
GDPSIPFIYWLLIATIAIPDEKESKWKMPSQVYLSALIVLCIGYFMGGILKIFSPSWANGSAMQIILGLPNTRFGFIENLSNIIPSWIFVIITFSVILIELFAPVFLIIKNTRKMWWILLTAMHILVLFCFTITQVSIGMLLYHLFLLDLAWIKKIS